MPTNPPFLTEWQLTTAYTVTNLFRQWLPRPISRRSNHLTLFMVWQSTTKTFYCTTSHFSLRCHYIPTDLYLRVTTISSLSLGEDKCNSYCNSPWCQWVTTNSLSWEEMIPSSQALKSEAQAWVRFMKKCQQISWHATLNHNELKKQTFVQKQPTVEFHWLFIGTMQNIQKYVLYGIVQYLYIRLHVYEYIHI